jgi:hypothetical protein
MTARNGHLCDICLPLCHLKNLGADSLRALHNLGLGCLWLGKAAELGHIIGHRERIKAQGERRFIGGGWGMTAPHIVSLANVALEGSAFSASI